PARERHPDRQVQEDGLGRDPGRGPPHGGELHDGRQLGPEGAERADRRGRARRLEGARPDAGAGRDQLGHAAARSRLDDDRRDEALAARGQPRVARLRDPGVAPRQARCGERSPPAGALWLLHGRDERHGDRRHEGAARRLRALMAARRPSCLNARMGKVGAGLAVVLGALIAALPARAQEAPAEKPEKAAEKPAAEKPAAAPADDEYHTPLAGEPLKAQVFGEPVDVAARDRSQVFAGVAGAELVSPKIADHRTDLLFALYYRGFYESNFARASVSFVQNDIEFAQRFGGVEAVARAATSTIPGGQTEVIDDEEAYFDRVKTGRVAGER